ncbi:MAG: DUF3999 domain-containing protein [Pseudomonas sp.]
MSRSLNRALLLCAAVLVAPWVQAEQPADYAVQVPLQVSGNGPWYRLELPMALQLAAEHADLRDLRVFNAEGEALAYALTPASALPSEKRQEAALKWFPLMGAADQAAPAIRVQRSTTGTLVEVTPEVQGAGEQVRRGWLLDASAFDQPLHRLRLDWSGAEDGFQRFSIEASDDLQHWSSWGEGQVARLSFANERIDQREIELPGAKAHYLRLLWLTPQQAPTLLAAQAVSIEQPAAQSPLVWSAALPGQPGKPGEFSWELPLSLPLERVKIDLPQANTLAPVSLAARQDGSPQWRLLARGLLYRLPQDGQEVVHDQIELYGQPVRELRLQVDPRGGGLGTQQPQLQVAMRASQVVFLARGSAPYRLAVGRADGQSTALPLATLIPGYQPERLAALGSATVPAVLPAELQPQVAQQVATDWQRIGLWAVLLAGVALLGSMAFSLLRKPSSASGG